MNIDINTKFITLIGTPLAQSFAARMQNAAYEAFGLNMVYFYTEADQSHLGDIVEGIRHMNFAGFAVTKPNKVEILKYLDELDPLCEKIGSCNTVLKTPDGRLKGFNTDGMGFMEALIRAGVSVEGKRVLCIGSGGVGRAICTVLAEYGASKIYINDISRDYADNLVDDINRQYKSHNPVAEYRDIHRPGSHDNIWSAEQIAVSSYTENREMIESVDIVINASGIGMGSSMGKSPVSKDNLRSGHFCFDACYNPAKTQFLIDAESKGCRIMNGLDMSLYQGLAQIEIWTGREFSPEPLRAELDRIMTEIT